MQINNKLREALERCADWGERIDHQLGSSDETVYTFRGERCLAHNISECARAALAAPATAEKSSAVGDAAKLREALEFIKQYFDKIDPFNINTYTFSQIEVEHINESITAALSAPPRNCDVPLVVDGPADNNADKAWLVFTQHNPDAYFDVPGLLRCIDWLLAPATEKEGGAK